MSARASVEIRVRGRVQGVGFRPMVYRQARELGLAGHVFNTPEGLLIRVAGRDASIDELISRIEREPPPLAAIASLDVATFEGELPREFQIVESRQGGAETEIAPDAALCDDCRNEIFDPFSRRYRYPFTTCTNCGPRLSIVRSVPYDRARTSMAGFDLCPECMGEYRDPADRRFHAETVACHRCGPKARLIRFDGRAVSFDQASMLDDVDAAMGLIQKGEIVAIKGLGGYQLACDATRADAVERLRRLKQRDSKPFALMARDLDVVRRYCAVSEAEERALSSVEAPIVLLRAGGGERLPEAVAPGLRRLGFMLPTTPLHALLMRRMPRPVVMTSGNLSHAPQVVDDEAGRVRLGAIAPFALVHDRDVVNRVDDSVVRLAAGEIRMLRRSRGHAPAPIRLPAGFERAPEILAFGGDLKAVFALSRNGEVILSQHIGDLDDAETLDDMERSIALYREMTQARPALIVCDRHPGYRGVALAGRLAAAEALPLVAVQHHHAHVAACLAENGRPLSARPVLGVALDGLGYGEGGEIWGGEFLLADYLGFERLGTFKPVAMPGGNAASREPWRNLYAHLLAEMGWPAFTLNFAELPLRLRLSEKPLAVIDGMLRSGLNAPRASSCGRLFDAVAAAVGVCFDEQGYEGEAAARLEAAIDEDALAGEDSSLDYPFNIPNMKGAGLPYIEPLAMWSALLGDLILGTPTGVIAARFHRGLARAICNMAVKLARRDDNGGSRFDTIALSGGCFHNAVLLEQLVERLRAAGFEVLTHRATPSGDGGMALGQAAIAAARRLAGQIKL